MEFDVDVVRLHGRLMSEAQDSVVRSGGDTGGSPRLSRRRVILSTPIAESSLTIEGIGVVVDSGLRKSPVYNSNTGECASRMLGVGHFNEELLEAEVYAPAAIIPLH